MTDNQQEPFIIEEHTVTPPIKKQEVRTSYRVNNIIAFVFFIVLLLVIFFPEDPYDGGIPFTQGLQLTDILNVPLIILGFVAGISFIVRVFKLTRHGPKVLRIFAFVTSIGGGVFIVLVSLFGALIGQLRGHPIST